MNPGLQATFALLAKTNNEAATAVLLPGLDSDSAAIRRGTLRALLDRRSPIGQREILSRIDALDENQKQVLRDRRGRLAPALRDALLGHDEPQCRRACRAVLWFREYDQVAVLVNAAEDRANPNRGPVAATLRDLAEALYNELAAPRDYADRRDPQLVRRHMLATLEHSVERFGRHKTAEIVEALLLLAGRENLTLKKILSNPRHEAYLCLNDLLRNSGQPGLLRLLLSFLDDPAAPSAALAVIAHRADPRFVSLLLNKIGREPSSAVKSNLRRIEGFSWMQDDPALLDGLDAAAQHGAVQLAIRSAIPREQKFGLISHLLRRGSAGGRLAAAEALPRFSGSDANRLALVALNDPDPQVQATVLLHLRRRGIPGVVSKIVERAESPHPIVRLAVREALSEFTFPRFCAAYDTLDESIRRTTAQLVRKVDPESAMLLAEELRAKSRTRRLRGLSMAVAMDLVPQVETQVIRLLGDTDYLLRCESAAALEQARSDEAVQALREALLDKSVAVRDAAENALETILQRRGPRRSEPPRPDRRTLAEEAR